MCVCMKMKGKKFGSGEHFLSETRKGEGKKGMYKNGKATNKQTNSNYKKLKHYSPYISLNGGGGNGRLVMPRKFSCKLRVKSYV